MARRAPQRRVAAVAGSLSLAVEAEVLRLGDEHVVDEDRGVPRHPESLRELRAAVVFRDETDLVAELPRDALGQQTCRVGEVSRVGPADEGDRGPGSGRRGRRAGGRERREVSRQDVVGDRRRDGVAVASRRGRLGLRGLEKQASEAMVEIDPGGRQPNGGEKAAPGAKGFLFRGEKARGSSMVPGTATFPLREGLGAGSAPARSPGTPPLFPRPRPGKSRPEPCSGLHRPRERVFHLSQFENIRRSVSREDDRFMRVLWRAYRDDIPRTGGGRQ